MKFFRPDLIHAIWLVIALAIFYIWAFKKRKNDMEKFAQKELIIELVPSFNFRRRYIKASLVLIAFILCIISLMRPQWGFHWKEVKRKGLDILVAIDTSKSMLTEDVKPNRLERSKLAVKDLVRKLKGDRIGLIAFAGTSFLQCPLTVDYDGFMTTLDDLNVNTIPRGGTSISSAIYKAIETYGEGDKKYSVLVIITDGEDHEGDLSNAAEGAGKEGIKIFCIGIGTEEGELIPIAEEEGTKNFLKDASGNVVKSRLNEDILKKIAIDTGGSYVRATGAEFGLDLLYEEKLSKMEKREFDSKLEKKYEDRFQIPLTLAFLLLIIELFINEKKRLK